MSAPAPTGAWGPDLLGPGFEARTLELLPDEEDDGAVATLVRHVPASDPGALPGTPTTPTFALLYIHNWNNYFFQTELTQQISHPVRSVLEKRIFEGFVRRRGPHPGRIGSAASGFSLRRF